LVVVVVVAVVAVAVVAAEPALHIRLTISRSIVIRVILDA
jgi:hypothetical protein